MALTREEVDRTTKGLRSGIFDLGEGVTPEEEFKFGSDKLKRDEQAAIAKFGKKQIWLDVASTLANVFSDRDFRPAGTGGVERIRGRFGEEKADLLQQFNVALAGEQAQQRRTRFEREGQEFDRAGKLRAATALSTTRKLEGRTTSVELDIRDLPLSEEITTVMGNIMKSMGFPTRITIQKPDVSREAILDIESQIELGATPEQALKNAGVMTEDELFQREIDETELRVAQKRLQGFEDGEEAARILGRLFDADTEEEREAIFDSIPDGQAKEIARKEYDAAEWKDAEQKMDLESARAYKAKLYNDINMSRDNQERMEKANALPSDLITNFGNEKWKGVRDNAINLGIVGLTSNLSTLSIPAKEAYRKAKTPEAKEMIRAKLFGILTEASSKVAPTLVRGEWDLKAMADQEAFEREEAMIFDPVTGKVTTGDEIFAEWTAPDGRWRLKEDDGQYWQKGHAYNQLLNPEYGWSKNQEAYLDRLLSDKVSMPPAGTDLSKQDNISQLQRGRELKKNVDKNLTIRDLSANLKEIYSDLSVGGISAMKSDWVQDNKQTAKETLLKTPLELNPGMLQTSGIINVSPLELASETTGLSVDELFELVWENLPEYLGYSKAWRKLRPRTLKDLELGKKQTVHGN